MKQIDVLLFDNFTLLDAFGPVEVFQRLEHHYTITLCSVEGGAIAAPIGMSIETGPVSAIRAFDILLLPGGLGTRQLVHDRHFIDTVRSLAEKSEYILTVCTGSALLAATGLIKHKKATSNKRAFDWAADRDREVNWVRKARWTFDGKYYTSSGVSAGVDMALGFVKDRIGEEAAIKISRGLEYNWNNDSTDDPFA